MFRNVLSFSYCCFYSVQPSYATFNNKNANINNQKTAKMNDREHKRGLGTNRFNGVFLKICTYDPTSKFQKLQIGSE